MRATDQQALDFNPRPALESGPGLRTAEHARRRFEDFHRANPRVFSLFERFALQAARAGRTRYSARTIIHRIRWYVEVETTGDHFKVNNDYSPFYARMFVRKWPMYKDLFEMRTSVADGGFQRGSD